jgi:hypothetical protein
MSHKTYNIYYLDIHREKKVIIWHEAFCSFWLHSAGRPREHLGGVWGIRLFVTQLDLSLLVHLLRALAHTLVG